MYPNEIENEIIEESLNEVSSIFQWAYNGNPDLTHPKLILVGGWAVDVYNPWYGSIDIDLMITSKEKKALLNYLYKERKLRKQRNEHGFMQLFKKVGEEEIIIDFVTKEQEFFKTNERVSYDFTEKDLIIDKIRGGRNVIVPTRSNLLLMKIKAAWDRYNKLQDGDVENISYVKAKYTKDCGDIIALLDTTSKPEQILDLRLISKELTSRSYLMEFVKKLDLQVYGRLEYRNMNPKEMKEKIATFVSLIESK